MVDKVIVWGGLGEKRSNGGTQWYLQDRVYCVDGLCPALNSFVRGYLVIVPVGDCDESGKTRLVKLDVLGGDY